MHLTASSEGDALVAPVRRDIGDRVLVVSAARGYAEADAALVERWIDKLFGTRPETQRRTRSCSPGETSAACATPIASSPDCTACSCESATAGPENDAGWPREWSTCRQWRLVMATWTCLAERATPSRIDKRGSPD